MGHLLLVERFSQVFISFIGQHTEPRIVSHDSYHMCVSGSDELVALNINTPASSVRMCV